MRRRCSAALGACLCAAALANPAEQTARIEARSADLVLVGVVAGETLRLHISRLEDNSPVRDAVVTVNFRGAAHPAAALVDGGYELQAPELALPGATALEFEILRGTTSERLGGTLKVAATAASAGGGDSGNTGMIRQLAWWVLNFAVCGGFLVLWSRRKRSDES